MSTEIREGDTVCLRVEGKVEMIDKFNQLLIAGKLYSLKHEGVSVEIIERRSARVGDRIKPVDHPDLPEHTVLLHLDDATIVKLNGKWHYEHQGAVGSGYSDRDVSWDTFEIVYLP